MRRDKNCLIGESQECSTCGKIKPLSDFPNDRSRIGGIRGQCRMCRSAYTSRRRSIRNPPILATLRAEAVANLQEEQVCLKCGIAKPLSEFVPHVTSRTGISKKCRSCIQKDATKEGLSRTPEYKRNISLQLQYGISYDEYMRMFHLQGCVCAICHKPESRKVHGVVACLCVDHDHVSGRIRGLLCSRCNLAVGQLNEDIETALALVEYLKEHKEHREVI